MMTATPRSTLRELNARARYRAARAVDAALDRWVSFAVLAIGLAGAATAAAAEWLA